MATSLGRPVMQPADASAAARPLDAEADNVTPAVRWWATLGGVVVIGIAAVLIRWVTGPYWKNVPQGPTKLPTWMHVELLGWQILSWPAALGVVYFFVVRPWLRERRVGIDGIMVIGFCLMWFQDPLSSGVNHWFVYNTAMVNMGSWANSVPGFAGWGTPGHMTSEPLLFTPAAYIYIMTVAMFVGTLVMRTVKRRFPGISTMGLVAGCYVFMCVFDIVLEGIIWLPLGVFEYPGGHWTIFSHTYHPYPLEEMFTIASVFTGLSCLRYFVNDKGQMLIERGVERVKGSENKRILLRGLAAIGAIQLIMFLGYNVTNGIMAANVKPWPKAVQERSYFTNGICGATTDRYCPTPALSDMRVGAAYINANGGVTYPKGVHAPKIYPFIKKG